MQPTRYEADIWSTVTGVSFFEAMTALVADSYACAPNVDRRFFITEEDDKVYMNMAVQRPESFTGEIKQGQIWRKELYPSMSETQIAHLMIGMSIDYAEHEAREGFLWRGRRVFGPHIDLAAQWEVSETYEQRLVGPCDWGLDV